MHRRSRKAARRAAGAALALGMVTLGLAQDPGREAWKRWELKEPAPVADGRVAKLDRLDELTCTRCHAETVEEWAATAHGLSWVDPIYQEEVGDRRRPESCWGCHIPQALHVQGLGDRPEPRKEDRHFGVSCDSCHLGPTGEQLGPRGAPTSAHRSERSETMIGAGTNRLCISCHNVNVGPVIGIAKDFVAADLEAQGKSCVGCHMAPVERRWASEGAPPPDGASTGEVPVRAGRSHALQTPRDPAFLRLAFEPSLSVEGSKTVVLIANRAGHRVPGLIGRSIEFKAELLDASGKTLRKAALTIDTRSYLPVEDRVRIEIEGAGAAVRLIGLHHDPRLKEPVQFMDELVK